MNDITFRIYFVEASGEKYRTIQAGVESTQMVDIVIFHFDASQNIIPHFTSFGCNLVYIIAAQFFQIQFRLFGADERRSYTYIHLFAFVGFETNHCTGMLVFCFQLICIDIAIGNGCRISKRLVELQNKIVLKVFRNSAAILRCVADYLIFRRDDFYKRTVIKSIYNDIRIIIGKCKTESGSSLCRSYLSDNIMIGKVYFIVIRSSRLSLVREPAGTLILIKDHLAGYRHDSKLTIVINPGTGLVCLFKSSDFISIVRIGPSISHLTGLRNPEVHPPGKGDSGISVSRR